MSKAGDTGFFPTVLFNGGSAESFADQAAFTGAGYALVYLLDGVVASIGTFTVTPATGMPGGHVIGWTRQKGVETIFVVPPAGRFADPDQIETETESTDLDSLAALFVSSGGIPSNDTRATTQDIEITENDSFARELQFPSSALVDYGFTDLSDTGWVINATVRLDADTSSTQPPSGSNGAALTAYVSDGANNLVTIAAGTFPAGLALSTDDRAAGGKSFLWDCQASIDQTFNITGRTTSTVTIAGDHRKLFSPGSTVTIAGALDGNGANIVVSAVKSGSDTVITLTNTAPSTVAGTITAKIKITGLRGNFRVVRQEDFS